MRKSKPFDLDLRSSWHSEYHLRKGPGIGLMRGTAGGRPAAAREAALGEALAITRGPVEGPGRNTSPFLQWLGSYPSAFSQVYQWLLAQHMSCSGWGRSH